LILEDCAYAEGWLSQGNMFARGLVADAGRVFFKDRQHGRYQQGGLPETLQKMEPLAPYLRADGKVDLRNT